MKDLSLHILDIAQNAVSAGAGSLVLELKETDDLLTVVVVDDGRGMTPQLLAVVTDPFVTTRTTRKVGLGLSLLRLAAEQTGGCLTVESLQGTGTRVAAIFCARHIDCPPLGDMAATVALLIQGAPHMEVRYTHATQAGIVCFDSGEIRAGLGPDVSLSEPEVTLWIRDYIEALEDLLTQ